MNHKLITIHNVEGRLLTSRVITNAANVEYHSEKALKDTAGYFNVATDQLTLTLRDNCESFQEITSEVA
jgi:hypothetical protein